MFRHFFYAQEKPTRMFAVLGVIMISVSSLATQYVLLKMTMWNGTFFKRIQELVADPETDMGGAKQEILTMLKDYVVLLLPAGILHPLISYTTRRYTLSWRMALIRGYLREWEEADLASIEGSSQRVQEDTQKFADGMQLIFIEILAAVFALAMFSPFLVSLGATVQPPSIFLDVLGYSRTVRAPDSWLLILAISMALCGVLVASSVSSRLVAIDMDNQKAEAACRKTLVHAEESVDSPSPLAQHKVGPSSDARSKDDIPIVETIQVDLRVVHPQLTRTLI